MLDRTWSSPSQKFEIVSIAASAGGIFALRHVLGALPASFPLPIVLAQHRASGPADQYVAVLQYQTRLKVKQADEGERARAGVVYVPPGGRHLTVNNGGVLSVECSGRIRYVCPSADVMFGSVAASHGERAIAVVLTGHGRDGAIGAAEIRRKGGFVIAQDESSSHAFDMPSAAIETRKVDLVLALDQIAFALCELVGVSDVPLRAPVRATHRPAPDRGLNTSFRQSSRW